MDADTVDWKHVDSDSSDSGSATTRKRSREDIMREPAVNIPQAQVSRRT